MNAVHAQRWLDAFAAGPEAAVAFYADDFVFDDVPLEQAIRGDKAALGRAFAPFANRDPGNGVGLHRFTVLEYIGDARSGVVHWQWIATDAAAFFGLPTGERTTIETTGMSFHQYRDGLISRELVYWDQIHPIQRLGYPVQVPHYWEQDAA